MKDTDDAMNTPAKRLRQARKQAGYRSARAFALAHGLAETTYNTHETGKDATHGRGIPIDVLRKYAELLKVDFLWLLEGEISSGEMIKHVEKTELGTSAVLGGVMDEIGRFFNAYQNLSEQAKRHVDAIFREELLSPADKSTGSVDHSSRTKKQRGK